LPVINSLTRRGEKNQKFGLGIKPWFSVFLEKKKKNLLSITISSLPDLSGKKCWSFDVSEITVTDGSLILILFYRWKTTENSGPSWILRMLKTLNRRLFEKSNNHTTLIRFSV
jgi:hypothetical protein